MPKFIRLSNGNILTPGKSKSTGQYILMEYKKNKWEKIFECPNIDQLKSKINHLKKLSDKSEYRKMIANITGTSYSAACQDMCINH